MLDARAEVLSATAIGAKTTSANTHSSAVTTISAPVSGACPAARRTCSFEPYSSSAAAAGRSFADEFDAACRKRIDQLHQRVDITTHDTAGCLHALDCWKRQARAERKSAL